MSDARGTVQLLAFCCKAFADRLVQLYVKAMNRNRSLCLAVVRLRTTRMVPVNECPICREVKTERLYRIRPADFFYGHVYTITHLGPVPPRFYEIWICSSCGHCFVNPRLLDEEIVACYPAERGEPTV
jgi:hypothetical protein